MRYPEPGFILIVDDNPTNLAVLSPVLKDCGLKVRIATDGESAIEQVENELPDLILLDVQMPGIDGFETCRCLKSDPKVQQIPIIFMTALSEKENKVRGLSLGAVDYITKPFDREEVIARVKVHLELYYLKRNLERRVEERTSELTQALEELQQFQVQLVQSEKMATIGELVAGIAHEINNPVSFISGNLTHLDNYTKDLINLVQLYREKFPEPGSEIEEEIEAIELDYIIDDIPTLVSSMQEGTKRIGNISQSMRTFSRSDTVQKVKFDLREGIESTLLILKHRLKANEVRPEIEIVEHYGNPPEVECYPGQLNQVFMNILANAIDALDEKSQDYSYQELEANPNKILIRIELIDEKNIVSVQIKDNGFGISDEVKPQIFKHLFTTKAVGKGTGLGLSIARQIVEEKHGGRLLCHSVAGMGTEFTIEVPI
jgi:signal transduction histidine kinase